MTETANNAMQMPGRQAMVEEAIARFDVLGLRSQLLTLDTVTLRDLGLRLSDRRVSVREAWKWLNGQLGVDLDQADAVALVDDNAVYRFADHFRRVYSQVRAEHARRLAKLTVAHATDANIRAMTRVAQSRLVELTAEKLVEADNFDDLGKAVNAAMFAVKFAQESDLSAQDLERKNAKLEADLAARDREWALKQQRLDDRVKALRDRIDDLSKRAQRGDALDPSLFTTIREQLVALASPPSTADGQEASQ